MVDASGTIVIPGWRDADEAPPPALIAQLRAAHARGALVVAAADHPLAGRRVRDPQQLLAEEQQHRGHRPELHDRGERGAGIGVADDARLARQRDDSRRQNAQVDHITGRLGAEDGVGDDCELDAAGDFKSRSKYSNVSHAHDIFSSGQ